MLGLASSMSILLPIVVVARFPKPTLEWLSKTTRIAAIGYRSKTVYASPMSLKQPSTNAATSTNTKQNFSSEHAGRAKRSAATRPITTSRGSWMRGDIPLRNSSHLRKARDTLFNGNNKTLDFPAQMNYTHPSI